MVANPQAFITDGGWPWRDGGWFWLYAAIVRARMETRERLVEQIAEASSERDYIVAELAKLERRPRDVRSLTAPRVGRPKVLARLEHELAELFQENSWLFS